MKIILANYRYYVSGGPEIYMFNIKKLLEDNGHEVIPYSVQCDMNESTEYASYFPHGKSESGDAYYANVKKTPRNIARLLSCAFYNREAYLNLRKLIRDASPDVVYVLQQINALSPSIFKACHDEGVRVVHRLSDFNMMCPRSDFLCDGKVCTACIHGDYSRASAHCCCHGSRTTTEIRIASMRSHKRKKLFDLVNAFVCPTQFTAGLLAESGVEADRIKVIPTFTNELLNSNENRGDYALYLGRIGPEKGIDLLVKAVAKSPYVRLVITGRTDSPYAQSIVKLVSDLAICDRVNFVGFVQGEHKAKLIEGASCIVCPSIWFENMPNVILEAYASSKPVVTFDIGCMKELVEDGKTGYVVPLGDINQLGEAVEALTRSVELASKFGTFGKEKLAREYSSENHLNKLLDVLSGI